VTACPESGKRKRDLLEEKTSGTTKHGDKIAKERLLVHWKLRVYTKGEYSHEGRGITLLIVKEERTLRRRNFFGGKKKGSRLNLWLGKKRGRLCGRGG